MCDSLYFYSCICMYIHVHCTFIYIVYRIHTCTCTCIHINQHMEGHVYLSIKYNVLNLNTPFSSTLADTTVKEETIFNYTKWYTHVYIHSELCVKLNGLLKDIGMAVPKIRETRILIYVARQGKMEYNNNTMRNSNRRCREELWFCWPRIMHWKESNIYAKIKVNMFVIKSTTTQKFLNLQSSSSNGLPQNRESYYTGCVFEKP